MVVGAANAEQTSLSGGKIQIRRVGKYKYQRLSLRSSNSCTVAPAYTPTAVRTQCCCGTNHVHPGLLLLTGLATCKFAIWYVLAR